MKTNTHNDAHTRQSVSRLSFKHAAAIAMLGSATLLTGCNNAGEGAASGAALGALAGLGIGSLSGDAGKGAAAGAIGGAILGGVIGDKNRREEQSRYERYDRYDNRSPYDRDH